MQELVATLISITVLLLLLLHGSGRSHQHPMKEPNVAHGVVIIDSNCRCCQLPLPLCTLM
jgi:hypothetical protein